jgi:radical SAM superfamily enzyme YgiQ (UPF0313 family)
VRACDQELMALGLTLPGFVERSQVIASLPSLGLLTLAGMTPKHHQITYLESEEHKDLSQLPHDFDFVAISTYSAQIFEAYEIAGKYKEFGVPTVIGGPHVSVLPEEAAQFCDSVVIGEGELVWLELLNDYENKIHKKFYGSLDGNFNLDDAPMPAFELLKIEKYNRLTVQTSRGCPHLCDFCASSTVLSKRFKQKPIEKVLAEIDKIKTLWKNPFIELADDNTFVNEKYWMELLPEIQKRNIKWFTETDISIGRNKELLKLIRESGCAEVLIGLESPQQKSLENIELNNNWKMKQSDEYRRLIRNIQSFGIRVNGCFILGLDNQSVDIFDDVFNFAKELELFDVQITILTAFPGTKLYFKLLSENRIIEQNAWQKCTLFDINFKPQNMTFSELQTGFRALGTKIYSEEMTIWRRDNFKHKYLRARGELYV